MKISLKNKIRLSVIAAMLMLFASVVPSAPAVKIDAASSVQSKIDEAVKKKQEAKKNIDSAKQKKSNATKEKESLDNEIDILQTELDRIQSIISDADNKISEKEAEITEFERQIEDNDQKFRARLRAMDENNSAGYIDILLSAESISDFFAKIETIKEISEHDQEIINNMIELKNGVIESKRIIEEQRDEQVEAKSLVEGKKAALNAKIAAKSSLIRELEKDIEEYKKVEEEQEKLENQLKASLRSSLSTSQSAMNPKFVSGKYSWPTPSCYTITSPYGYRIHPVYKTKKFHSGIDIGAGYGAAIVAVNGGKVTMAGWNGGYGNCIVIDHGGGIASLYGHLSSISVSAGATVSKGQQIGKVGSTGVSTGPHLHFEMLKNGSTTNPMSYFN